MNSATAPQAVLEMEVQAQAQAQQVQKVRSQAATRSSVFAAWMQDMQARVAACDRTFCTCCACACTSISNTAWGAVALFIRQFPD